MPSGKGKRRRRRAAAQAAQAVGKLEQTALAAKESLGHLRKLEEKGKKLEEEYGRTNRLAALLSGKNACKVPLHQFVLGVMLDDILSSANQFFATLSSGRYSLSRVVGATSGNALGGLDLEVIDAYTGGARAVETLSGGELFLASLSLAFGLSDVVQSYSGGVHLDSLFIDEGFGSLDQETLGHRDEGVGAIAAYGAHHRDHLPCQRAQKPHRGADCCGQRPERRQYGPDSNRISLFIATENPQES